MSVLIQDKMVVVVKVFAKANFSPLNLISQAKLGLYWDLPSRGSCLSTGSADSPERLGSRKAVTLCGGICKCFHDFYTEPRQGITTKSHFDLCGIFWVLMSVKRQRSLDHHFTKASSQFKAVLQLKSPASLSSPHIPPIYPCGCTPPSIHWYRCLGCCPLNWCRLKPTSARREP